MTDKTPTFDEQLDEILLTFALEFNNRIYHNGLQYGNDRDTNTESAFTEAMQAIKDLILTTHEAVQPEVPQNIEPKAEMNKIWYRRGFDAALDADTAAFRAAVDGNNKETL